MKWDARPWMEHGVRGAALLKATASFTRSEHVNLLEENAEGVAGVDSAKGVVPLAFRPFEIITLKLT